MAQFPNIITTTCISTTPPPPDPRCADPAFALANPGICSTTPVLILKPSVLLTCSLGSVQFETYQDLAGVETQITSGVIYSSSNPAVALISASTGSCTGVSAGEATITASYNGQSATASLTVMGSSGAQGCCTDTIVATVLLVDTSKSMSSVFGGGYATRESYAQALATQYAQQTNTQKGDLIGLVSFDATATTLVAPGNSISAVTTAIAALSYTQNETSIGLGLQAAISALAGVTADIYCIVLISDGENEDSNVANDPITISTGWQSDSNIIICAGVRASETDNGFNLLNGIATGGFFVNSYPSIAATSLTTVMGLKGYICAGNCVPPGNVYTAEPQLDYTGFANWNVVEGTVDLLGPGLYDLLPGNGLYVYFGSITNPTEPPDSIGPILNSKTAFTFTAGKTYSIAVTLAGNQMNAGTDYFSINIAGLLSQIINITSYTQGFQTYTFNFTPNQTITEVVSLVGGNLNQISTETIQWEVLLNKVVLTDVTDLVTMLSDNFDTENIQYTAPGCGAGTSGTHTQSFPLPAQYSGSGFVNITGLSIGTTYTFTPQDQTGDYCIICGATTLCVTGTFTATATTAMLTGFAGEPVLDTLTYTAPIYYYGYAGCYGYGCLSSPPGDQSPDPNPLPDIEAAATGQTPYTSTQTVTVYCPAGTQQVGGGSSGATGTATYTSYISQQDAINNAIIIATANANLNLAAIGCQTIYSSTQSYTATCPSNQFGAPATASATATSTVSQTAAQTAALAQAQTAAQAMLTCTGSNNLLPVSVGSEKGPATPYPSVQYISGLTGSITKVVLTINNILCDECSTVAFLLVSPSGQGVVILSAAGGNTAIIAQHPPMPVNLTFEDSAGSQLSSGNVAFTTGNWKPSGYNVTDLWESPAPQPSYGTTMAAFNGENGNGSWSLWLVATLNDSPISISSWALTITSV